MEAKIYINKQFQISKVDPRLFGGFIEHLGRAVYEGIYEPEHESADEQGFRQDVINLVKKLNMPVTRYPGGNFVSGYNWEDGIGPREKRPERLDLAWKALETNEIGINEFIDWCKKAGTQPMIAVNLGTRGAAEAQALVEYCNHPGGSHYSDLRKKHGWDNPHAIKLWCLGNEMDGSWQMGHKSAKDYGKTAREAAKVMKWTDSSIELVVCGSSGPFMDTFASWEAEILDQTIDLVDYISIHRYYGNRSNETAGFLAQIEDMDRFIKSVVATCDYAAAKRKIDKKIMLSFDEWNVWFHSQGQEKESPEWSVARPILEDVYTMEDALLVGGMLITLLNNADRVKIGCLAQTVNVIAPIMTRKGGGAWCQTIFYPFMYSSKYGRGTVMLSVIESPTYQTSFEGNAINDIPYLSCTTVLNTEETEITLFVLNRNLKDKMDLSVSFSDLIPGNVIEWVELRHDNLKATNSETKQQVSPIQKVGAVIDTNTIQAKIAPASWNMLRISI